MILIGLTGNIASGKSEVARMLAERGATLIDADVLAREAVEPDTQALKDIVKRWGKDVLKSDGSLDRGALRQIVFADQNELDALNRIVHPGVTRLRDREIAKARERGDDLVVCVIPLLFERNLVEEFDAIVLVDAPRPLRLERLVKTRGLDETDRRILRAVLSSGCPLGLKSIAVHVGEADRTIADVYEPFLIQRGFLVRTARGRRATRKAAAHLRSLRAA